ncbi:MAG: nucleotidyl transferase [Ignavibacteria bacterium GWB2_35_12]|nr:MAG: nucleotidyl transferase [Ignavibacteria bacterium GWA2_35_8]OGU42077.1 MAG: nucleotidyl transferase [Ignavibacteria bacterium GWB2_35_12]OGU92627.1 MAG: nucleotidyl transferase [Ignavibacteria bacterium RIFOXYA2_FULL_35_10]OGV24855.1 MAG: nucleotidyl transferase [Ignavibacteria bacterium RIFOXYC2_FULL_35_21]
MRAIIPVAGVGTRLRPHTYTLPKVLLNVGGKPILGHILDTLIAQGIEKATIVTGYMRKLVEEYVRSHYKIDVSFVKQDESLGLGHAIWVARKTFDSEPLLIILGDTIFDVDLSVLKKSSVSTIGVKEVDDPRRFGVVVLDKKNRIEKFVEKPQDHVSNLAIVGLYYISNPQLLRTSLEELLKKNIKTQGEYQLTDALQLMREKGEEFSTFPVEGWFDCGKPETLLNTNRYLLDKYSVEISHKDAVIVPPVYIAQNAVIERSVIGPYATVADGATVIDSVVRDSIISDGATVTSSLLESSIIGNNAYVRGNFNRLNVGNSSEINYG